jgi:hypothetical protein
MSAPTCPVSRSVRRLTGHDLVPRALDNPPHVHPLPIPRFNLPHPETPLLGIRLFRSNFAGTDTNSGHKRHLKATKVIRRRQIQVQIRQCETENKVCYGGRRRRARIVLRQVCRGVQEGYGGAEEKRQEEGKGQSKEKGQGRRRCALRKCRSG